MRWSRSGSRRQIKIRRHRPRLTIGGRPVAEFDAAAKLKQLREASDRIASNLLELEGHPTVAMLDAADLCGVTAEQWQGARLLLAGLFAAHTELKDVVEQGTRLSGRGWLLTVDRQRELEQLLMGP